MEQRLAARNRDHGSPKRAEFVDAAVHVLHRDWLGEVIEFVAVSARQIAPAHGDDVGQKRVLGVGQRAHDHLGSAQVAMQRFCPAPQGCD